MKRSRKLSLLLFSLVFISSVTFVTLEAGTTPPSRPREATSLSATCWCKISKDDLWSKSSATGVLLDLTPQVNKSYYTQSDNNQKECESLCRSKAYNHFHDFDIAQSACASGVPSGTRIQAFSAVGQAGYRPALEIGILVNQQPVTQTACKCPTGWQCNGCSPQVDGGYTSDGHCKKVVGTIGLPPYPPDGTQIGSWGFTLGE